MNKAILYIHGIWRNALLGVFVLCEGKSNRLNCSDTYSLW